MMIDNKDDKSLEILNSHVSLNGMMIVDETIVKEGHHQSHSPNSQTPTKFYGHYQDFMEMYAPVEQVEEYFNSHGLWFVRCAEPIKVCSLCENSYVLVVGRFGAFGYEIEPKVGLQLLPPENRRYDIITIPVPDYQPPGYNVSYKSSTFLVDDGHGITKVEWNLDLVVELHFPWFIRKLPHNLIQSTGDRLLNQIVRQVSRHLTHKVQKDFHYSLGIPFGKKCHKK
ncbi:DUF1997 domain-containing protein [Anabaena sp. FACHB-1237]|uniref:DUF1997 domain-containing protein n=1 Tax=Anabaena sp. FACHB-1237 TaxID=2692769 RepID=UPI00167FF9AA|nr:DUF1997 domain-containing protein [Anabaena sp. FACHB-1237]MBD2136399.1 DUF1997 domain-containing protein [Anabaena sp. FACHB-1237]